MLRQAQKMEAVGQLSGGIAHDFNNMLTIVLANLDKARRLGASDPQLQQSLDHAITGASRAAELTDRLLSFARKQPLQPARHDPNALIADVQALLGGRLGERIAIETSLAADVWPVMVDKNQMESAVLNLAINAQQAMPNGGTLTLITRNVAERGEAIPGRWVMIEVRDDGVGMSGDVKKRALEPFYTTKPLGEGTGLGLSQVYGFISQSDGEVQIESEVGKGTSVRIYLPSASD